MTDEHTERYCLACEKSGHLTTECYSTHGLNTPRDRELFRLTGLADAERERILSELRALLDDKPFATALSVLAALTPSEQPTATDVAWAHSVLTPKPDKPEPNRQYDGPRADVEVNEHGCCGTD